MAGGHLGFKEDQLEDPAFSLEKLFLKCFKPFVLLKKKQEEKFLSLRAVAFIQGPI